MPCSIWTYHILTTTTPKRCDKILQLSFGLRHWFEQLKVEDMIVGPVFVQGKIPMNEFFCFSAVHLISRRWITSVFRCSRASASRDITVPSGTSATSAISL